jgi:hypothetical protein
MIYYSLDNINIHSQEVLLKIIHDIRNLILQQQDTKDKVLTVSIKDIIRTDNNIIPKIEYKNI